jgi:ABC-type glycerol-3-phosphate transport system substrate-binding protein
MAQNGSKSDELKNTVHKYTGRQITRREFLRNTAVMGLTLPAISGMLPTSAQSPTARRHAAPKKEIKGHVAFSYDGWGGPIWDEIFGKVQQELPGVEVEKVLVAGDEMADKSIMMCASGQMTWDIVVWMGRIQDHIDGGYILPVDGLVKQELIDDLTDVYKEVATVNGRIWSLPWYQNAGFTILYNKGMFAKAGFDNGPALTWKDFADQLYKIKEQGIIAHPFVIPGMQNFDSAEVFDNIVKGHGGYWFEPWKDAQDIKPAFTTNPHNMEAAEWIGKLIKDQVVNPACMNFEADGVQDVYLGGDSAAMLNFDYIAANALDTSKSKVADQTGCALIPGTDGQHSGGSFAGGQGYYIYSAAKERDIEAIVAVFEILAGPWANTVWAEKAALGPAYKSIQNDARVLKGMPFMPIWTEQTKYSVVRQTNPQWERPFAGLGILTEWSRNREAYLSAFYTGGMDAKTLWSKMEEDYLKMEERAIQDGRKHTG